MEAFVMRLWAPDASDPDAVTLAGALQDVRGIATHVTSGAEVIFTSGGELLSFLIRQLERHPFGDTATLPDH